MTKRDTYRPSTATGASIDKTGEQWTLILRRELNSPINTVWTAITQPEHLHQWAPFDTDQPLTHAGVVHFSTVGIPNPQKTKTHIRQVIEPTLLEYSWGDQYMRWELATVAGNKTQLTLWHTIDKGFISMGAAGWHICLDVLNFLITDEPIGRIVGPEAMKFDWPRLNRQYAEQFGIKPPKPPAL